MVLAHGDVDGRGVAARDKKVTAGFLASVVIEDFLCATTENYHLFTGHSVSMDWDNRSGLNGIQHPLRFIIKGIPEVEVLA